jgi:hypothetical protein
VTRVAPPCPKCKSPITGVCQTRVLRTKALRWRRFRCSTCLHVWGEHVPIKRGVQNVEAARRALLRHVANAEDALDEVRTALGDFVNLVLGAAR